MKSIQGVFLLLIILGLSQSVSAKTVSMQMTMKDYNGNGAYAAVYLTDAHGHLIQTLSVAGRKKKYQKHLRDWKRASRSKRFDGKTGASIHSSRSQKVVVTINDKYIDANNVIHIDTAVENRQEAPAELVVPLTSQGANRAVSGRNYIESFVYAFR